MFRWLKSPGGQRFTDRLGQLIERPGGAMWLGMILIFISQITLKPYFPDETHALVNDWAYFVKNLLLFWLGYLFVSRQVFWQLLANQRRIFLWGTIVCTCLLYGVRAFYDFEGPDNIAVEVFALLYLDCLTWFSVLATVGYSYHYLNINHPILPYLNEAVYPFYILHQTVIVVIGYYLLKTNLGVYDGFLAISLSAGLVCVFMIWFLIRPFRLMRFLLGMK